VDVVSIPNISEGRDLQVLGALGRGVSDAGATVLDAHSDAVHNRSVLTIAGDGSALVAASVHLAVHAASIDMARQTGVHPRLGGLDVCPFVPLAEGMEPAVELARTAARAIAEEAGVPVFLYGEAEAAGRTLPELRRGGLVELARRIDSGLVPDHGPARVDLARGVVCVGARGPLIAFNVNLRAPLGIAGDVARAVRETGGGLPGVRALGFETADPAVAQVSMNLVRPQVTGVDRAFEAVEGEAARRGAEVVSTEIVGLPPERFMPDPEKKATRLLVEPGRSLESALAGLPPSG
jgi:glutamate formiminotransferase